MQCGLSNVTGARIAIYPMQDDFVEIILGAVKNTDKTGLAVTTDDLGTTIQGNRDKVFRYVKELFINAAKMGGHVTANVLFSVGCPGDVPEDFDFDAKADKGELIDEDMRISCAWSLYPLGNEDYFQVITDEVSKCMEKANVETQSLHYCTRLDGTAKNVFDLLEASFEAVSKRIRHTIIHATFSKGSPSKPKEKIEI